jgi:hypothetical protein
MIQVRSDSDFGVNFFFCLILCYQAYISTQMLDHAKSFTVFFRHVVLHRVKIAGQSEFIKGLFQMVEFTG